ncbi:hypothetical protein [Caulobacter rhizosphaerae]|uniref:hypothetical protein n=1 Tax=Caulobacter rhizosphaerae TaxID=2010972 RepID=UPI0013D884E0|nr:hypothetical protein [Caulobacter rhizosphaerae]GGL48117.1 hypothetical protein GCM10010983_51850 [Caulobacter rhizosphaerae]
MSTEILATVRAFLATPAAQDVLGLESSYLSQMAHFLERDGTVPRGPPRQQQAATSAWLLGLAAEHGASWRHLAIAKIIAALARNTEPALAKHLAEVRSRARALADAGELTNAVESLMRALMADPRTTMPQSLEILLRMDGLKAALAGREAVRKWIEVFV